MIPRGPHTISQRTVSREYALFCLGRFVSQARGEQDFFGDDNIATASEGCKSNALMRCCKDLGRRPSLGLEDGLYCPPVFSFLKRIATLGIASELWDPVFIRDFKKQHAAFVQATHVTSNAKKWVWKRKDRMLDYPYKEEVSTTLYKR